MDHSPVPPNASQGWCIVTIDYQASTSGVTYLGGAANQIQTPVAMPAPGRLTLRAIQTQGSHFLNFHVT